nr:hypothetical protein [uncultured Cohaesibacter sp.]
MSLITSSAFGIALTCSICFSRQSSSNLSVTERCKGDPMIDFETIKKEWEKDPEFQKACKVLEPEFRIANALIKARKTRQITQPK